MKLPELEQIVATLKNEEKLALIDKIWRSMTLLQKDLISEDRASLTIAQQNESTADKVEDWKKWVEFKKDFHSRSQ